MDIKSITNTPDLALRASHQLQLEQISALVKTLNLKSGDQFIAQVNKVSSASADERAELMKSIETALAQLNKNITSPAIKALVSQLLDQKALVETPSLKLVSLNLSNPLQTGASATAPVPFLSYTTQPLALGQNLLMQLAANQRIQILEPISTEHLNKLLLQLDAIQQQGKPVPSSLLDLMRQVQGMTTSASSAAAAQAAISQSLRELLPIKDRGQDLLGVLPKINQFIQQLPLGERSDWISSGLQNALKILNSHLRVQEQLGSPKALALMLDNNGQRFEQKLAQALGLIASRTAPTSSVPSSLGSSNASTLISAPNTSAQNPTAQNVSATNSKSPELMLKQVGINNTEKLLNTSGVTNGQNISLKAEIKDSAQLGRIIQQDLKGALLGVLHQVEPELTATTIALGADATKLNMPGALPQLLNFLMQKQPAELSQKQLRAQLAMLVHQYTLGSLAKIQLQQIHTLNHQQTQADQPQPTQSWQMEIPVRQGQDIHPLTIQLEQKWIDDPNEPDKKETKRVRQWNVMLGFDLPLLGHFYAQLALLNNRVSIKFWAENENTLAQAQNRLESFQQQLEHEGIQIAQLQCLPGLPPTQKMSVNYSLVDIKT
ncbi:flagellar hook-length control protein FliK [Cellvibrio fontiphilus]|uniref:Flagellar hook-length control protein FliK n=1 Tax=Cellvibrio fontiphilus TaxID=1815559 RepID=A0ABV7FGL4_9GAMM